MPKHPRSDLQRLGTNALDRIKGMLPGSIEEVAGMLKSVVDSRFGTKPVGETIGTLLTGNRIERTKAVSDIGRVGGALAKGFGDPVLNIGLGAAGAFAPEGSVLGNLGAEAKENIIKGGGIDEILALAGGGLSVVSKLKKASAATKAVKAVKKPKGAIPRERRVTSRRAVGDEVNTVLDRELSDTERRLSRRRSKRTGDFQKKLENPISPEEGALVRAREETKGLLDEFEAKPRTNADEIRSQRALNRGAHDAATDLGVSFDFADDGLGVKMFQFSDPVTGSTFTLKSANPKDIAAGLAKLRKRFEVPEAPGALRKFRDERVAAEAAARGGIPAFGDQGS